MERTVCSEQAVILHDVQHSTHLTEYEDAGSTGLQGSQELVQNNHFPTVLNEMFICGIGGSGFLARPSVLVLHIRGCHNVQPLRTGTDDKRPCVIA